MEINIMNEYEKCKKFIKLNGGVELDPSDDCIHYDFHGYGIDINNEEIVFINDTGDFKTIKTSYYELLGYMLHSSMLGIGFKRI